MNDSEAMREFGNEVLELTAGFVRKNTQAFGLLLAGSILGGIITMQALEQEMAMVSKRMAEFCRLSQELGR